MESSQHSAFFNYFRRSFVQGIGKVDFEKTRVKLNDDDGHRLFLCGGPFSERPAVSQPLLSMRDLIHRVFLEKYAVEQLVLAEAKADNSIYKNENISLLKFEEIISEFSTAVIVVLESVGSFVEIGSFTSLAALKDKLYTLMDDQYSTNNSFLVEGPLKELKDDRKHVLDYRFSDNDFRTKERALKAINQAEIISDEMLQLVEKTRRNRVKNEQFSKDNHFHFMLFVCKVIEVTCPLRLREIHSLLESIDVNITESFLEVLLQLCEDFGLLKRRSIGNVSKQSYYCANKPYASIYFAGRESRHGKVKFHLDDFGIKISSSLINSFSNAEKQRIHLKSEPLDD